MLTLMDARANPAHAFAFADKGNHPTKPSRLPIWEACSQTAIGVLNMQLIAIIGLVLGLTSVAEAIDLFGAERLTNHQEGCPPKAVCAVEEDYQTAEVAWCEAENDNHHLRCSSRPFVERANLLHLQPLISPPSSPSDLPDGGVNRSSYHIDVREPVVVERPSVWMFGLS